jgi:acyl dehydratase
MAESKTDKLYFEDYAPDFVTTGGEYRVTSEEILEFGRRFDPQPFHTDPEAAARSHFGGLVAPGCLTFSIRTALVNQLGARPALVAGLGVEKLDLPNPVRPGDVLSLRQSVVSRRLSKSKPDRGIVTLQYEVRNQAEDVVLSMTGQMLVALRDPSAG